MSLNNNQDDNTQSFDAEFSEEQNFDSDPAVVAATQGISSKNKSGWLILIIGILGTGAYLGYRYYLVPHGTNLSTLEAALVPSAPAPSSPAPGNSTEDKLNRQVHKNAQFERLKASLFESNSETTKTAVAVPAPSVASHVASVVTAPSAAMPTASAPIVAAKPAAVASPIPVSTPVQAPVPAPIKTPEALSSASINDAAQRVAQLNERLEADLHQIQHLEEVLQGITQTIAKLNSDISAMDNRLLALNNASEHLSNLPDMHVPPPPSHTYLKASQLASARAKSNIPAYVVHAIIPGRAWLKSNNNGQITTVTEGDTLGDYGKVLVIDAASGMVLTSSGNTFQ